MEYKTIKSYSESSLNSNVNSYIRSGWKPIGGICCSERTFLQAMIKDETDNKKEEQTMRMFELIINQLEKLNTKGELIEISNMLKEIIENSKPKNYGPM